MRLTLYTDYAMRVLLHLGTHDGRLCAISEIARAYGISQNHLMKVVNDLARAGYVESVRGRAGGIRLGRPAETLNVGEVVRHMEQDFALVDCQTCIIAPACGLNGVLCEAAAAFLAVLDRHSLADLIVKREALGRLFAQGPAGPDAPALPVGASAPRPRRAASA